MNLLFWRKKRYLKKPWGYFIAVDYSGLAKRMATGGMRVKKIYHIKDDGSIPRKQFYLAPWSALAFHVEDYDPVVMRRYEKQGISIIDDTRLTSMPVDATKVPVREQAMDMLEWRKRTK